MITDDLDRIAKLGFDISISWNKDITILYPFDNEFSIGDELVVLIYVHPEKSIISFDKVIPAIVDEFNSWYSDNYLILKEHFVLNGDPMLRNNIKGLGNITYKINRELKIGGLLDPSDYDF